MLIQPQRRSIGGGVTPTTPDASPPRLDPHSDQKLGATDAAIIFWRRRMPWKSRDAQRIWGKTLADNAAITIEQDEKREAVETPLS